MTAQDIRNFYKMNQDAFSNALIDVVVPDLGTGGLPLRFVTWLVPLRSKVIPGERLAELLTQGIVLHLEAVTEGALVEQRASPGDEVSTGGILGRIRPLDD